MQIVSETGSTNADLLARAREGADLCEGSWLIADRQNAGRGRRGRAWLDGPGNFTGSTVVRIATGDPAPSSLSFVAALAVYEALLRHIATPALLQVKWPNDILFDGAKLAGILLERAGDTAVVGIGVNLAWSPALSDRSTSNLGLLGPAPDRDAFADDLARGFEDELDRWRRFGLEPVFSRWLAVAHPVGAAMTVHDADGTAIAGTFAGLEPDGALRLRLADGAARVIHAGEVALKGS